MTIYDQYETEPSCTYTCSGVFHKYQRNPDPIVSFFKAKIADSNEIPENQYFLTKGVFCPFIDRRYSNLSFSLSPEGSFMDNPPQNVQAQLPQIPLAQNEKPSIFLLIKFVKSGQIIIT